MAKACNTPKPYSTHEGLYIKLCGPDLLDAFVGFCAGFGLGVSASAGIILQFACFEPKLPKLKLVVVVVVAKGDAREKQCFPF